jgi:hypothetical protein
VDAELNLGLGRKWMNEMTLIGVPDGIGAMPTRRDKTVGSCSTRNSSLRRPATTQRSDLTEAAWALLGTTSTLR